MTIQNISDSVKNLKGENFSVIAKPRCFDEKVYTGYGIRIDTKIGTFHIDDLSEDREAVVNLANNLNKEEDVLLCNMEYIIDDFLN